MQPSDFLSEIELYYTPYAPHEEGTLFLEGEEFQHAIRVMRHKEGELLFITDGQGKIYKTKIIYIDKNIVQAAIIETFEYLNKFSNIVFCVPKLKNPDRFEFALEKCVELGITNFIVYDSKRTFNKGNKIDRWLKITMAAMKQSLRSYLPQLEYCSALEKILEQKGHKIIFDQNADKDISSFIASMEQDEKYYLIWGPEGGLDKDELNSLPKENKCRLTQNRLRSETAIVLTAGLLSTLSR